jgi:hypothetical protein
MSWSRGWGVRKENAVLIGSSMSLFGESAGVSLTIFEVGSAVLVSRVAKSGFDLTTFVTRRVSVGRVGTTNSCVLKNALARRGFHKS